MFHSLDYLMTSLDLTPHERIMAAMDYLHAQPHVRETWLTLSTSPANRLKLGRVHVCVAWLDDRGRSFCAEGPPCGVMFTRPAGGV